MEVKTLDAKNHIDLNRGCRIRYVRSDTEYFRPHDHNYYEIFLFMRGKAIHLINSRKQSLIPGSLLFIRDFDIHDYASENGESFEFLNLSFEKNTLELLFDYLGDGYCSEKLLKASLPPNVILSERDKSKLFYSMMEVNSIRDEREAKTKMRTLLLRIFTDYFSSYSEKKSDIPLWLELTYEKMKKPENFIDGVERMLKISGKSREHLARSLKKYYALSPVEYVSELRLNYAINLMSSSNLSITDICFECGFSNLSWFYKLFENKYHMTPAAYKKKLYQ